MTVSELLLWVAGSAVILSTAAAIVINWIRKKSGSWSDRSIEIGTQILGIIPGTSIALAAAIATVSVGGLALSISERESVEEQLDSIHRIYAELSIAISNLIRAGHGVLWVYHGEGDQSSDADMSQALKVRVANLNVALDKLDDALHALQLSFPATQLLIHHEDHSALSYLSENSTDETEWVRDFFPLDLGSLRLFIHDSRQSLSHRPHLEIDRAHCMTLLDSLKSPESQEMKPLQWVVFTGHLLGIVTETSWTLGPPNSALQISLGLAMFHDLFFSIPSGDEIVSYIRERSGVRGSIDEFPFDPAEMMGERFVEGMTMLQSRFDLLLMTSTADSGC